MHLRWTEESADDLERITNSLFDNSPERAAGLVREIYDAPAKLLKFPFRGRPGKKEGTRELKIVRLPYIVVYRVKPDVGIDIVRILHSAQKWP